MEHLGDLKNSLNHVCAFQIELGFGSVSRKGKTRELGEKPLAARERTNKKFNPQMASLPGFKSRTYWWETNAVTTALPLLPS